MTVPLKTLQDGREFPTWNGKTLAWDFGLYMTTNEGKQGYPRAFAVLLALKHHRPDQFKNERRSLLRASFDRIFGRNAQEALALLDKVAQCTCQNPEPGAGVAGIGEDCPVHNFKPDPGR